MAQISNNNLVTLSGGNVSYPKIAVESYCNLIFGGTSGDKRTVTCGGSSVTAAIGVDGTAYVSLLPFIRMDIKSRNVQNIPCQSPWRGSLSVDISQVGSSTVETTITVYYIYGYFRPRKAMVDEVWMTYNSAAGDFNVVGVDLASHYTNGVPSSIAQFRDINSDPSRWGSTTTSTFQVLQVASTVIFTGNRTYHLADDCRTDGIKQVRWIDADGYLNTRKLAISGESASAGVSESYRRPRTSRTIVATTYDYGKDEWATMEAQRTITLGDDAIPQNQWDWLKGLATSVSVEVYEDGLWVRCNISDCTMERDPRRDVFTFSITLAMPTDEMQQF